MRSSASRRPWPSNSAPAAAVARARCATLTEIYHFLRLLYVKLGTQYCPDCDVPIEPQSSSPSSRASVATISGKSVSLLAPLVVARKGFYTDLATWAAKKGYEQLRVDGELLPTQSWPRLSRFQEHTIELPVATVQVSARNERELRGGVDDCARLRQGRRAPAG